MSHAALPGAEGRGGGAAAAAPAPRRKVLKILMLGESAVGKSTLVARLTTDRFEPGFVATVGIDFKTIDVVLDGVRVKCQIWDSAGQEKFRTVTRQYYRNADGIVLVFDVTLRSSFQGPRMWAACGPGDAPLTPPSRPAMLPSRTCRRRAQAS